MLKTSLQIDELTCRIGKRDIIGGDLLCVCAPRVCDSLAVTGCVSDLPRARAHAYYFARYFTVMVKIRTLGINVAVALASSLVWFGSI